MYYEETGTGYSGWVYGKTVYSWGATLDEFKANMMDALNEYYYETHDARRVTDLSQVNFVEWVEGQN